MYLLLISRWSYGSCILWIISQSITVHFIAPVAPPPLGAPWGCLPCPFVIYPNLYQMPLCFLAPQDVSVLSSIFLATALESTIFPRSIGSFNWRMIFRNQGLSVTWAHCNWGIIGSLLSQWTELGKHTHIHTHTHTYIYIHLCKCYITCLTPCDPMDCSPPGSSVHGILQARILEWVAMPSFRGSSDLGIELGSTASVGSFFTNSGTWEAYIYMCVCVDTHLPVLPCTSIFFLYLCICKNIFIKSHWFILIHLIPVQHHTFHSSLSYF